ncbi:MAG TPA: T9SS type A sorting domain-containing protein, partial [Flavisolibacter sp.]|nr:T9SS type A sorting domain-containing protein [Flavisolibacter sp.]
SQTYIQAYMSGSSTLTVKVYSPVPELADVLLFDMNGRQVARRNVFLAQGFMTFELPVMMRASGMYIVKVIGNSVNLKSNIVILK